jgi:hypothetical protein
MGHANTAVPQILRGTSTLTTYTSTHTLVFCQTVRESLSITFCVDMTPFLYENYVVVILYAVIREDSFLERKICYRY